MTMVADSELQDGDTVYSLIDNYGDLISFEANRVLDTLLVNSQNDDDLFEGEGAVFHDGIIEGVVADGSEMVCSIDSVQSVEIDRVDTLKLLLTLTVIAGFASMIPYIVWQPNNILP
jgi:hypothetical protein